MIAGEGGEPAPRGAIALLSPCGHGNLGDAAILESLIHALRARRAEAEILAFTLNAPGTALRHGVKAYPCSGISPRHYGASRRRVSVENAGPAGPDPARPAGPRRPRPVVDLPWIRPAYDLGFMVREELRLLESTSALLRSCDTVVVAGGGQLDEFWGGPFGHPYALYRWSRLARRHRARFLVLSVGTGTLGSWMTRAFVGRALARADYRSFRDPRSRELASRAFAPAATDPVVPDLAYAWPVSAPPLLTGGRPLVVGLAPIAEGDPRLWPNPDPGRYRRHLEQLAGFARRALAAGMIVRLFATDGPDQAAARALHGELAREAGPERLALEESDTLPQLANLLGRVDVVVAARLHAVLLAQLLGRPALALSYERKVATLMSDMGQDEFCLPLEEFEPERGFSLLGRLAGRLVELSASLRAQALERRRAVLAQYDRLFIPKSEKEAA